MVTIAIPVIMLILTLSLSLALTLTVTLISTNVLHSLQGLGNSVILAVNQNYCEREEQLNLRSTDEIAIIPPISG
eukprot:Pgem_evm1s17947